eukprot:471450_1
MRLHDSNNLRNSAFIDQFLSNTSWNSAIFLPTSFTSDALRPQNIKKRLSSIGPSLNWAPAGPILSKIDFSVFSSRCTSSYGSFNSKSISGLAAMCDRTEIRK